MLARLADLTASLASARGRVRERARVKQMTRAALRSDLVAIGRTAAAIALGTPELDPRRFRPPPNGDQRLLTAARSVAGEAVPLRSAFIAYAMAANFLDVLNQHIQEFERARTDYLAVVREREDAEAQIEATMQDLGPGAKRLDAVVRNALREDPTALAAWDKACQSGRTRVSRRVAAAPATDDVAAAASVPGEAA